MEDKISIIVKNVKELEDLLTNKSDNDKTLDDLKERASKDLEVIQDVIKFEEASDNYEAANILRPIENKIVNILNL